MQIVQQKFYYRFLFFRLEQLLIFSHFVFCIFIDKTLKCIQTKKRTKSLLKINVEINKIETKKKVLEKPQKKKH